MTSPTDDTRRQEVAGVARHFATAIIADDDIIVPPAIVALPSALRQFSTDVSRAVHDASVLSASCIDDLQCQLSAMLSELARLTTDARDQCILQVHRNSEPAVVANTARLIEDECLALFNEFDKVVVTDTTITVRTETIVLDHDGDYETNLGRFDVRFRVADDKDEISYTVRAVDKEPNSDDSYHPHVREDTLCEGSGATGIAQALQDGRIFDAMVIIQQVMQTYNHDSTYSDLENWHQAKTPCDRCGDSVPTSDVHTCADCKRELCDDCAAACDSCDCTVCPSCRVRCCDCNGVVCPDCQNSCFTCGCVVCDGCVKVQPGTQHRLCSECFDKAEEEAAEEDDEDEDDEDEDDKDEDDNDSDDEEEEAEVPQTLLGDVNE